MVAAFDRWLINWFEAFSHWTQKCCGMSCHDWALVCLVVYVVSAFIIGFDLWNAFTVLAWSMGGLFLLVYILYQFIDWEKLAIFRLTKRVANSKKISSTWLVYRLAMLTCVVHACVLAGACFSVPQLLRYRLEGVLTLIAVLAITGFLYFDACDPLPPSTSKLRTWLDMHVLGFAHKSRSSSIERTVFSEGGFKCTF